MYYYSLIDWSEIDKIFFGLIMFNKNEIKHYFYCFDSAIK